MWIREIWGLVLSKQQPQGWFGTWGDSLCLRGEHPLMAYLHLSLEKVTFE